MKLIVKYIFLADILFLVVVLDLNKYIFPWQMCFMLEVFLHSDKETIQLGGGLALYLSSTVSNATM